LPPGLTLSAAGTISGTPTMAGTYSGAVTATNGTAPDDIRGFTITIAAAPGPGPVTPASVPTLADAVLGALACALATLAAPMLRRRRTTPGGTR
jgi:hypothetical protein